MKLVHYRRRHRETRSDQSQSQQWLRFQLPSIPLLSADAKNSGTSFLRAAALLDKFARYLIEIVSLISALRLQNNDDSTI